MDLSTLSGSRPVRLTDRQGNISTGMPEPFSAQEGLRVHGREEEGVKVGDRVVFSGEIADIRPLPTCEEARRTIPAGFYRHFMGGEYEVTAIARHSETGEAMVVYRSVRSGDTWVRPADMWNETLERNGKTYRRFYALDRIRRVEEYERLFEEATACPDAGKLRILDAYYTSGQWLEDYEADERGELPPDLKRGVLSQDALSALLEETGSARE